MSGLATPGQRAVSLASIQAPVKARLDRVHPELLKIVVHGLPAIEAVSGHLLKRLGKMFRPTLSLLASDIDGNGDDRAITCAAAIELMHLATLVHDDSVDHSVKRRGQPTVNALFSHEVSVIMGDFLYSRALQAMVSLESLEIMRLLTECSNELAVGEMRQLGAIDKLSFDEDGYVATIRSKTGSLLRASCETGTFFGAIRWRAEMSRYGERLGLAFQIADDLIDYVGDEAVTGKPSGADLKEHKVTLPLIAALRNMSPAARKRVEALFANSEPSDELVHEVVGIVSEAGGLEYARLRGAQFAEEAQDALATLPESPVRAALADAIVYVMDRRS